MKALVTGAGGFIGARLCSALLQRGWSVRGIGRRPPPEGLSRLGLAFSSVDLAETGPAAQDLDGVDAVFHVAGANGGAKGDAAFFLRANELAALNVFSACAGRVPRVIHASSQVVYGEPAHVAVTEDFPLDGFDTPYACSKVHAEGWLRHLQARAGATAVSLRLSGFLGGGGAPDYFVERAAKGLPLELLSEGKVRRDYLSIDDGVAAFIAALEAPAGFSAYNVGSGKALSTLELARLVCRELGSSSEIVPVAAKAPKGDLVLDIGKARRELGFSPAPLSQAMIAFLRARDVHA